MSRQSELLPSRNRWNRQDVAGPSQRRLADSRERLDGPALNPRPVPGAGSSESENFGKTDLAQSRCPEVTPANQRPSGIPIPTPTYAPGPVKQSGYQPVHLGENAIIP